MRLAIYATPTVLLLEYINGMPHLRGCPLGGLKPPDFPKILESAAKAHAAGATATPPVVQAALGAASALSPCVLPPLAVGSSAAGESSAISPASWATPHGQTP
jgi:hypothetical protein